MPMRPVRMRTSNPTAIFVVTLGALCWGQGQVPTRIPTQGDVYQTGTNPATNLPGDVFQTGKPGDVYQSGGCDNDPRHFIRNGKFDQCAWDRAHYQCDGQTKICGMPYLVPLKYLDDRTLGYNTMWGRCGVNACDSSTAVCWCPKQRP